MSRFFVRLSALIGALAFTGSFLLNTLSADASKVRAKAGTSGVRSTKRTPRSGGFISGQGSSFADILFTDGAVPTGCPSTSATFNRPAWLNTYGLDIAASPSIDAGNNCSSPIFPNLGPVNFSALISYGAIGGQLGITAFTTCTANTSNLNEFPPPLPSGSIDFASLDAPFSLLTGLPPSGLIPCVVNGNVNAPIVQVPAALGSIALGYNNVTLPSRISGSFSVPTNGLTRAEVCGIFQGTITDWQTILGGSSLPITVYYRFGGNGVNYMLTKYLNAVCPGYPAPSFAFPVPSAPGATFVGVATNAAMSLAIKSAATTTYPFGYLDGGQARKDILNVVRLQNKTLTNFISPFNTGSIAAAATGPNVVTDIDPNPNRIELKVPADPLGTSTYSIVGTTYLWFYGSVGGSSSYTASDLSMIQGFGTWYTTTATTPLTAADKILAGLGGYGKLPGNGASFPSSTNIKQKVRALFSSL